MGNKHHRLASVCAIMALVFLVLCTSCGNTKSAPGSPPESASAPPGSFVISPKSQTAKAGSQIKVSIEIIPAGWGVSAAEVQLSFDPAKLEALSVKAGGALGTNPLLGTLKIDNDRGTIVYALARVGDTPTPGVRGILANFEFRAKSGATGTAKIELTRVGLSDENFQDITGVKYEGAAIVFP